ncbi:MAG: transposase, partial [Actinobacteria bacterium]|nr:transposase [Actinomycetota bacterium]
MAYNLIACDRDQHFLLPPSINDWLEQDHLARFIVDVVDEMDLSAFYARRREDGWGRAAFDPKVMICLLLYCYSGGERSSRRIERRCKEDVACRFITANHTPDHSTIARFRQSHEQELNGLFTEALRLCAKAGLVMVGLVALDGTKVEANASSWVNRTEDQIDKEVAKILSEAAQADAQEDRALGKDRRGDELPIVDIDPGFARRLLERDPAPEIERGGGV